MSLSFHVDGLDCAEEVALLESAVLPRLAGGERLEFDLLRSRMTVRGAAGPAATRRIREAVATTGLRARPWLDAGAPPEGSLWERRGREALCAASGLLIASAFAVHAAAGGAAAALAGGPAPVATIVLYLVATLAGAWFVLPKALGAVRRLRPDMNLLMTVAIAGAIGLGEWLEAASVAFLFAVALLLERWSVGRARRAIEALMELSPELARVVDPRTGETTERPVAELEPGVRVRVRPGERVPIDGRLVEGATAVDSSAITGESMPVERGVGDPVFAGAVNLDSPVDLVADRHPGETTLARILESVERARARRAPSERWVERFARRYTPAMMGLAAAVAVVPPLVAGGEWGAWFYRALVLLVIACPCALVISTPVAVVGGLARAARQGVLVKGGSFLELPARLAAFAFDKTGTLTLGRPTVRRLTALDGASESDVLARGAALAAESNHPLARAVAAAARERGVPFDRAAEVRSEPGRGLSGRLAGRRVWIGSYGLAAERGAIPDAARREARRLAETGCALVAVGEDDRLLGLVGLSDEPRPEAADAIAALRRLGVGHLVMLTGDHETAAAQLAARLGLDGFRAGLLPEEKVAAVEALGREHGAVAMVGDGINDTPALAAATLGVAMGVAGTDAALETADVALMGDDLGKLPWLVAHSRRVLAVIRQNVVFALGVKAVFLVLAGMGVATLWMAIAADMGASLLVTANGLRLLGRGRSA